MSNLNNPKILLFGVITFSTFLSIELVLLYSYWFSAYMNYFTADKIWQIANIQLLILMPVLLSIMTMVAIYARREDWI